MANGHIEILIGARADRSLETIFGAMPKRAEKARAGVERALNAGGRNSFKDYENASARAANRTVADQTRAVLTVARMREREERKVEAQRIASERRVASEQTKLARQEIADQRRVQSERAKNYAIVQREAARSQRDQARSAANEQRYMERSFAYRSAYHGIIRYAPAALHRGARFANDMLRGAGVDLNVGSSMARNIERENEAIGLAQQERMRTGGETIGADQYRAIAGKVGLDLKTDPTKILQLMRAFSGSSGEFGAIQGHAGDVASIALAKGADLGETGGAAGKLFNQLHNMPAVIGVLRALGAQTAVGALESRVMMGQIGRISAGSFKFEGGAATNIPKLFALAESAGEAGGADTAPRAATAVDSFVGMLTKGARFKGLEKFLGKDAVFDKSGEHIKDPVELIFKSIAKAQGNLKTLGGLFPDKKAFQVVSAFANRYSAAGGGAAGETAMRAQYQKYAGASLTPEIEQKNLGDYLKSTAASAQEFQTNLDNIVGKMAKEVMPALADLAPKALSAAKLMGDAAAWIAHNPGKAVEAAIVLSIGRAMIESGVRAAIEKGLGSVFAAARNARGGAGGGGGPGFLGRPSRGRMLGAGMAGLTIGAGIAAELYDYGTTSFDDSVKSTNAISRKLVNAPKDGNLGVAIIEAKNELKRLKDKRGVTGSVLDFFGGGMSADYAGLEDLIARRTKEVGVPTVGEGGKAGGPKGGAQGPLKLSAEIPPGSMAPELRSALQGIVLQTQVTNFPPTVGGSEGPPTPGPAGRARQL